MLGGLDKRSTSTAVKVVKHSFSYSSSTAFTYTYVPHSDSYMIGLNDEFFATPMSGSTTVTTKVQWHFKL